MGTLRRNTHYQDGEYRLLDHTGNHTIYDAIPFDIDGRAFWFPDGEVAPETDTEQWEDVIVGEAGEHGEIEAEVYLLDPVSDTMGMLRFEDSDRAIGMVADGRVLQQVTGHMIVSDEWTVTHTGNVLHDALYEAVVGVFDGLSARME